MPIVIYSNEICRESTNDIVGVQVNADWNGIHRKVLFYQGKSQIGEGWLCTAEKLNDQVGQHRHDLVCSSNFKRSMLISCWCYLKLWYLLFLKIEEEKREKERKEQEVKLNKLESLIYKFRRDDAVKQKQPFLAKLNSLLEWVEGDGQSASLRDTKSKIEEVNNIVSFLQ